MFHNELWKKKIQNISRMYENCTIRILKIHSHILHKKHHHTKHAFFHITSPFFPRNATNEKEDKLFQETNKNITILKNNNNCNKLALFRELNFLLELYALNTKKKFIYMLSCSRLRKTKRWYAWRIVNTRAVFSLIPEPF